jgi:chlorobactene glucosyltransferase
MFIATVYHPLEVVGLALLSLRTISGLLCQSRLRHIRLHSPSQPLPRVSILIPARNEADNIGRCVVSLSRQDYPQLEIIVLNDQSEDATADVVRSLQSNDPRITLLDGRPLPEGWVGKNWACHQLSVAASGEWLLFTDADTWHEPSHVSRLFQTAVHRGADLISSWPEQVMETWAEKWVVSLLPFVGTVGYPHALLRLIEALPIRLKARFPSVISRFLGAANGQVLMMSRAAYNRIGGHESVRNHLVEDIALGRAVAARLHEGMWWVNVDGSPFVHCRMYRDFRGVWEGFSKNIRAAFENHGAAFIAAGTLQFLVLLFPFVLMLASPWRESHFDSIALGECIWILLLRGAVTWRAGGSWQSVALHPFAWTLALLIGLNSGLRSAFGRVSWKGRQYQHDPSAGTKKTPRT